MDGLVILIFLLLIAACLAPGMYALHRRMKAGNGELELWRVLRSRGISPAEAQQDPHALGLAVRRCMLCAGSDVCRDWLASGRRQPFGEFCPNAAYLKKMEGR